MHTNIVLAVVGKISNLLIQESDAVLAVEEQIVCIESILRKNAVDRAGSVPNKKLRQGIYDIEDVIDELIIKSAKTRTRNASIQIVLAFADAIPNHFFHVLALFDLIYYYKLQKKLQLVKVEFSSLFRGPFLLAGSWEKPFGLSTSNTIISPVIAKLATIATQEQLSPAVRKQARWLRDEFKSLQDFVEQVESSIELSKDGMSWMEEVFNASRSTENVVGLFMDTQMRNVKKGALKDIIWAPQKFISQNQLAQQMALIKDMICNIFDRRYEGISRMNLPWSDNFRSFSPHAKGLPFAADQLDMVSFEEDVDAVIAQLLKDDPRCLTISIVGVAGTGKTSVASLIYNSKVIADHFTHRTWVSGAPCSFDIMRQILNDHSHAYPIFNEIAEDYQNRLGQKLNAFFADKRYLIIVDGLRSNEFWNLIGGAFRDVSSGTRIVFTARNQRDVPPNSDRNLTYRLHLRSNDESLALFLYSLKKRNPLKLEENVVKDILRKCGGLPKVIVKLGDELSQRDVTEWTTVLDQLNYQDEEHWSQVLEQINKYLPLYLRRCLFYFGLFPIGYRIPARRLIALWVAEGLGRQQSEEKSPEYVAESCLKELISCNSVQVTEKKINGKTKTCCLPEALRLHWFAKAKEANFLEGHNQKISMVRRLADHLNPNDAIFDHIHGNNKNTALYSSYKDVVSFLSFDTRQESQAREDVGNFLTRCISSNSLLLLWVLDLENVYKPNLPKAVGQLTLLRYLGLRSTYLGILPLFVDKLLNLQTLDLKRTHINSLPTTIWNMQKLRHLFLDESFQSMFAPRKGDGYLLELQTLWGAFVDEETQVRNGMDTLLSVTKLGLVCKISRPSQHVAMSSQLDAITNWVQNLKDLQSLRLKSFDESNQPWNLHLESLSGHNDLTSIYLVGRLKHQNLMSELPQNLMEITLSASGLAEDPMQTLAKLCNLRILILMQRSFIGKIMVCSFGGFPKLEVLKLKKVEPLEEWNVEEGALASLKDLEIESCNGLKMLPDGLQLVKALRKLSLKKMPILSLRINNTQSEDWNKISHVDHVCIED